MEQSDKAPSDNLPPQTPAKKRFSVPSNFAFIFIGILIGVAGLLAYQGHLQQISKAFYVAIWVMFAFAILSFVIFFGVKNYLTKVIFGGKIANSGDLLDDAQGIADVLTERIADKILIDLPVEDRNRIKNILPRLANWFFWKQLRNWWWQWIVTIFVSLTGITGTLLLINQNELLKTQNKFIKEQSFLSEGARRSSLVYLMGEIMQSVNEELKGKSNKPYSKERKLSPQLIARIIALSHSFKPYRYLDGDSLISRPLSPERGQLLLNIAYLKLDTTETLNEIFEGGNFSYADLHSANLSEGYFRNIKLNGAGMNQCDLRNVNLEDADLSFAELIRTDLRYSNLKNTNFSNADLFACNFAGADLYNANLSFSLLKKTEWYYYHFGLDKEYIANLNEANLQGATLESAFLSKVNLKKSDLSGANLSNAILIETDFTGANLTDINLSGAIISTYTEMDSTIFQAFEPKGLDEKLYQYAIRDSVEEYFGGKRKIYKLYKKSK